MTGGNAAFAASPSFRNEPARAYYDHSSAQRVNTDSVITQAVRAEYPNLSLSIVPLPSCNLLSFAASGHAAVAPIDNEKDHQAWKTYLPTPRRIDGIQDGVGEQVKFGKYLLEWKGREFVVYIADGRDGTQSYPNVQNQYVLSSGVDVANRLILEAGRWTTELHNEVWVFDGGFWEKSRELWESVKNSQWEDVILDEGMKKAIIRDVDSFFDGRATYKSLKVPWKRGVIYYGPPGNGKTISIKAMMHALSKRKDPVPTLYVRSLASFAGSEYAINLIFGQARRYAPCYLIFEDLDTVITADVRSYFFNEVDGLKSNDGIFMVGSTNHLDQLDPGIAKRPSRFDRKYLFPDPNETQRTQYAHYWQGKLKDNEDVEFPDRLCKAIAGITDGFSFAYMQEAFVAALLAIAAKSDEDEDTDETPEDEQEGPGRQLQQRPSSNYTDDLHIAINKYLTYHGYKAPHPDQRTCLCIHTNTNFDLSSAEFERFGRQINEIVGVQHEPLLPWPNPPCEYNYHGNNLTLRMCREIEKLDEVVRVGVSFKIYKGLGEVPLDVLVSGIEKKRILEQYSGVEDVSPIPFTLPVRNATGKDESVGRRDQDEKDPDDLDDLVLWREIKRQVKILKEEMSEEKHEEAGH